MATFFSIRPINWLKSFAYLFSTGVIFFTSCGSGDEFPDPGPPSRPQEIGKAKAWLTTGNQTKLLSEEAEVSITERGTTTVPSVTLQPGEKLQQIDGFGAALTGSSAYLINRKMSAAQRRNLLEELFDPAKGIGISYLRMTIGASDFSLSDFTYNDLPAGETDFDLNHFSIDKDKDDVIPVFKQILSFAPGISIMGSPWSAPAWMKTNNSLKGGKLKPEAYDVYARYFVKYIKAYEAEGIPIAAITPQNEPLHFTANYPCMEMQASDQLVFIRDFLGPAFQEEGLATRIITYDHNWDNTQYAISILNDPVAKEYVSGSAFHAYGGDVSAMSVVHNAHPDRGLYFTEISGGEWATNFADNLQWNMSNIFIGTTRNWSKNVLLWNLALDENHGPKNNGCQDCRGVVTIHSASGSVTRNVEYYSIGHFSRFVRPGAHRIASTTFGGSTGLDHVAFVNADGSNVVVVSNASSEARTFSILWETGQFEYSLPAKSVVTLTWSD